MQFLKLFILVFCAPLVCSNAYAMTIEDPAMVKHLKGTLTNTGEILADSSGLSMIEINISTPQKTSNQYIEHSQNLTYDNFGNAIVNIKQENPSEKTGYYFTTEFFISETKTTELPEKYFLTESIKTYLEPTENIQSTNPRIKNSAMEITKNSSTDFEKVAKMAVWIKENLKYTEILGSETKDAMWVLNNRMGTCDEYATLFIAMSRSIGIPAKYVYGYSYERTMWQKHAWAEAYIGAWIPVDSLWLEVGELDAVHIKFGGIKDNVIKNQVRAHGINLGELNWATDEERIHIESFEYKIPENYSLSIKEKNIEQGGTATVVFEIIADSYKILKLDLEPCYSDFNLVTIDKKTKYVILEPEKKTTVTWLAKVSDELKPNTRYKCPLTLNSNQLDKKTVNLEVDTSGNSAINGLNEDLIERIIKMIKEFLGL